MTTPAERATAAVARRPRGQLARAEPRAARPPRDRLRGAPRGARASPALLESAGFDVQRGGRAASTRRSSRRRRPGPVRIGVCAEYDALPDVGHACGHNVIAASSGSARALGLARVADEVGRDGRRPRHARRGGRRRQGPDARRRRLRRPRRRDDGAPLARSTASRPPASRSTTSTSSSPAPRRTPRPHRGPGSTRRDAMTVAQVAHRRCCASSSRPATRSTASSRSGGVRGQHHPRATSPGGSCAGASTPSGSPCSRRASMRASRPARARPVPRSRIVEVGLPYSHMVSDAALLAVVPAPRRGARARASPPTTTAESPPTISTDMANVSLRHPDDPPAASASTPWGRSTTSQRSPPRAPPPSADRAVARRRDRPRAAPAIDVATDEVASRGRLGAALARRSDAGSVDAEDAAQHVGDLAERRASRERDAHRHEQVLRPARRRLEVGERGRQPRRASRSCLRRVTRSACAACWARVDREDVLGLARRASTNRFTPTTTRRPSSTASASAYAAASISPCR